jgi:hypothetical protein
VRFSFFDPGPAIPEGDGSVENRLAWNAVGIGAEVAQPFELHPLKRLYRGKGRLKFAAGKNFQ